MGHSLKIFMWKYLNESVEGTSHRSSGIPCQDSSFVTPYKAAEEEVLVLVCADGAGSAAESQVGSKVACEAVAQQAIAFLESGHVPTELAEDVLVRWARQVHLALQEEAERRKTTPRELACTLLFGLVGQSAAAFCQIGDGAIVVSDGGGLQPIFWPQNGEYQNSTFFITDAQFEQHLQTAVLPRALDQVAMFTDGLQMLALNFSKQIAHEPFFTPMFHALATTADRQDLIVPMRQFLDSKAVNDRTDDDKTLVLATRVNSADATV